MKKNQLIYLALWGFLIGILLIVFLQVISGRNINRLIIGNNNLLKEIQIQNDLREIESDIITVESDVRGAVISENTVFLKDVQNKINSINANIKKLEDLLDGGNRSDKIILLDTLLRQKINFSQKILQAFQDDGKAAAEAVINTNKGRQIRDSIIDVITLLEDTRQQELTQISATIEKSGRQARTWGFILAAVACIAAVVAFWYIIMQSQRQQKMIAYLNKSEKKVKEAARLKEQFMANMSHEIRTPMNSIIGFTNLLRRTPLDANQQKYVQNIHSAGENLLALVNDILDLSKIEAGMMGLEEIKFSVRSLVGSVGAMFIEKAKEKRLNFQIDIDNDVPDILAGDAVRLTQILVNLISNAIKFTEKGEVKVHVSLTFLAEQNAGLRITVTDTGIGIAQEKLQYIFERFQQAEEETTRRYGGTGLGLSIVKQLVELQKGNVSLHSEPGKGSEFIIDIVYNLPDVNDLEAQVQFANNESVEMANIKVLIAEDNAMNQELIRHLMKSWTMQYTLVNNGEEAVEKLKQDAYSVVLMDIQMPQMDGYVATSIIRNKLNLSVPIIAMTAHAMAGEKEKCIELGMNDYISKPIKETVLFNLIAQYAQVQSNHTEKQAGQKTSTDQSLINLAYLNELSGNDKEFEKIMMEQFVLQTPVELNELKEAVESDDYINVKKVAHSLKSTVGYMGLADELHPYLTAIEKAAAANNRADILQNFTIVHKVAGTAVEQVNAMLQAEN